jgi:hypothetical protein
MKHLLNKAFLWLDEHQLCPHAIVERVFGTEDGPDWAYDLGLRMCTWIVLRLPEDG